MIKLPLKTMLKLTAFAFPLSGSALINMISNFIAMLMVAKLGEKELAAAAIAVPTFITITMVIPIFYAVGILISHQRGQGKPPHMIGELVKNGFWLAIGLSIPSGILLWNVNYLLLLFGQDPAIVQLSLSYFHFAAWSIAPMLIGVIVSQFYSGIGYPRFSMIISFVSLPLVVSLSYLFILGKWGFPTLGLAGVTCSTLIVQTTLCVIVLTYMMLKKDIREYQIFSRNFLPSFALLKNIFSLGFPIGLQFGGELAAMTVAAYFMGYFGVTALAAAQVVSQYTMLVVMISLGLTQALAILTSEAYGKGAYESIKEYLNSAMIILIILFIFIFILFMLAPTYLIQLFLSGSDLQDRNIFHLATNFFVIAAITLFADGVRNLLSGCLRGLHDSKAPMHIGIFCLWIISLPVSYIIGFYAQGGPIGLRIGFMSGFIIASFLLWLRTHRKLHSIIIKPQLEPNPS